MPSTPQPRSSSYPIKPVSMVPPAQRPRFIRHLQNATMNQGDRAMLQCAIVPTPNTQIKWFKDDKPIEPSADYMIKYDNQTGNCTLSIANEVYPQDSGKYTCVATNPAGSETSTAWLVVKGQQQPKLYEPEPIRRQPISTRQEPKQGPTPLRFGSIESSRIEPQKPIEIIKAYQQYPIAPVPVVPVQQQAPPMSEPIKRRPLIDELQQRHHSSINDDVFEPPNKVVHMDQQPFMPAPARIIRGLKPEQAREDDNLCLKALISGNPTPKISWYKNNQPLIMSQRHTCSLDEAKNIAYLKIKNVKPDDSGFYTIVVENPYGHDNSSAQAVIISPEENKPRQPYRAPMPAPQQQQQQPLLQAPPMSPPRITRPFAPETNIVEGESIVLSAIVHGSPTPQISYYKNNQPLTAASRIKTSYNPTTGLAQLKIDDTNLYDADMYKLVAVNPVGKDETGGMVNISNDNAIDNRPIVDPQAFKYLQPQSPKVDRATARPVPDQSANEYPREQYKAPNFVVGLSPTNKLHEGEPLQLKCKVEGIPKPTVINHFSSSLFCLEF
jgi:hypothetical protein